jgi:hypothetical protein
MKAEDFDKLFDDGMDVMAFAKMETLRSIKTNERIHRRINIDMPYWAVRQLDDTAEHIGITRQSLIKMWLVDRLNQNAQSSSSTTTHL